MNDFDWRNCNTCNSWNPKAQSSFLLTNPTRYEPPAKDIRFSSTAKVSLPVFRSLLQVILCRGKGIQQAFLCLLPDILFIYLFIFALAELNSSGTCHVKG